MSDTPSNSPKVPDIKIIKDRKESIDQVSSSLLAVLNHDQSGNKNLINKVGEITRELIKNPNEHSVPIMAKVGLLANKIHDYKKNPATKKLATTLEARFLKLTINNDIATQVNVTALSYSAEMTATLLNSINARQQSRNTTTNHPTTTPSQTTEITREEAITAAVNQIKIGLQKANIQKVEMSVMRYGVLVKRKEKTLSISVTKAKEARAEILKGLQEKNILTAAEISKVLAQITGTVSAAPTSTAPATTATRRPSRTTTPSVITRPRRTVSLDHHSAEAWRNRYTTKKPNGQSWIFSRNSNVTLGQAFMDLRGGSNATNKLWIKRGNAAAYEIEYDKDTKQYHKVGANNKTYANREKFFGRGEIVATKKEYIAGGAAAPASSAPATERPAADTADAVSEKLTDVSKYAAKLSEFLKKESSYNITEIKFNNIDKKDDIYNNQPKPHQLKLESVTVKSQDGKTNRTLNIGQIVDLYKGRTFDISRKILTVELIPFKDVLQKTFLKKLIEKKIKIENTGKTGPNVYYKKPETGTDTTKITNVGLKKAVSELIKTVKNTSYSFNNNGENKVNFRFRGTNHEYKTNDQTFGTFTNKLNQVAQAFAKHKTLLNDRNIEETQSSINLRTDKASYQINNPAIKVEVSGVTNNPQQLDEVLKVVGEVKKFTQEAKKLKITVTGTWPTSLKEIKNRLTAVNATLKSFTESINKVVGGISRTDTIINLATGKMEITFKGKKDSKQATVKLSFIYDKQATGVNAGHARILTNTNNGLYANAANINALKDYIQKNLATTKVTPPPSSRPTSPSST